MEIFAKVKGFILNDLDDGERITLWNAYAEKRNERDGNNILQGVIYENTNFDLLACSLTGEQVKDAIIEALHFDRNEFYFALVGKRFVSFMDLQDEQAPFDADELTAYIVTNYDALGFEVVADWLNA